MSNFRKDYVRPILVLSVICLFCAWAVSAAFAVTEPVILQMEAERAREARLFVLPQADDFEYIEADLPDGVISAYRAINGAGFVFQSFARGYGGNVPFMVGMDADGRVVGIQMLSNNETVGFRERVSDPEYLALFHGVDSLPGILGVDSISGVTRTSDALKNALARALQAYELVRG
ncbi:MAG: FMN-binding protein [Oscillospiraceae bacterium]|nr:FMN-binding protein [Oscillospiraceae bacterium]